MKTENTIKQVKDIIDSCTSCATGYVDSVKLKRRPKVGKRNVTLKEVSKAFVQWVKRDPINDYTNLISWVEDKGINSNDIETAYDAFQTWEDEIVWFENCDYSPSELDEGMARIEEYGDIIDTLESSDVRSTLGLEEALDNADKFERHSDTIEYLESENLDGGDIEELMETKDQYEEFSDVIEFIKEENIDEYDLREMLEQKEKIDEVLQSIEAASDNVLTRARQLEERTRDLLFLSGELEEAASEVNEAVNG